jgi:hypothetical protein
MHVSSSIPKSAGSPPPASPYGSDSVPLKPGGESSEGLSAYQLMMRPRSRASTPPQAGAYLSFPHSTDTSTAAASPAATPLPTRAAQLVDLSYSNPTFETTPTFSPPRLVRPRLKHPNPNLPVLRLGRGIVGGAGSERDGTWERSRTASLAVSPTVSLPLCLYCDSLTLSRCVSLTASLTVSPTVSPTVTPSPSLSPCACGWVQAGQEGARCHVAAAARPQWSRVGLTGSAAHELDAACRNAKDPDVLLHIENLEGEVRPASPAQRWCWVRIAIREGDGVGCE